MTRRPQRGFTLIEVMIAFTVLLVGLLGLLKLHYYSTSSNAGGRMHMQATELARELAGGLERLAFADARLSATGTTGPSAPSPFGYLLTSTGSVTSGGHAWDDADPVPGVRVSAQIPPGYQRRWTVWGYSPTGGGNSTVKMIAVSIIWTEPSLGQGRELIQYTQVFDSTILLSNITATQ